MRLSICLFVRLLIGRSEPRLVGGFLHLAKDFLETSGHVVRPLAAPVVPLEVLQEAEEESVNSHGVHTEERAEAKESVDMTSVEVLKILPGNEVASYHNTHNGRYKKVK